MAKGKKSGTHLKLPPGQKSDLPRQRNLTITEIVRTGYALFDPWHTPSRIIERFYLERIWAAWIAMVAGSGIKLGALFKESTQLAC